MTNVLVVGAGRMGQRHLRALATTGANVHIVEPVADSGAAASALLGELNHPGARAVHSSLEDALSAARFEAAILTATADGRGEQFERVAAAGVPDVLLEKPLEQSRRRCERIQQVAAQCGVRVRVNLYRRSLTAYHPLKGAGPLTISVSCGAAGLGCNGVHWIDFAAFLSGDSRGRLLFGELDDTPIASGRGPQFRDYGGRGVFAFDDGSRLLLSIRADSSAPAVFSVTGPGLHWLVDQDNDTAVMHRRRSESRKPNYLYGQDYEVESATGTERVDFTGLTAEWLASLKGGPPSRLPTLAQAAPAHSLLFDLLEISRETDFAFT